MKQPKIVVIDDVAANLKLLENILNDIDCQTRVFQDGHLALKSISKDIPDLILLDIKMPEINGYKVCHELKKSPSTENVPVIFISSLNDVDDKVRAFRVGGVDYITAPFQAEEVKARVKTHLEIRSAHRALNRHNHHLEELVQEQIQDILATKDELLNAQYSTVLAMSKLVESRDQFTGSHLERVQFYCQLLASELQSRGEHSEAIDSKFVTTLFNSCPLHDIGKILVPDDILLKEGALTIEEFDVMKNHTTAGSDYLKTVLATYPNNSFIQMGVEIAKHHHEKWDGSGYPDGLKGDEIPISAQIMAMADVYDALTSQRPYKEAFSHEKLCEIILAERGKQFSPLLCDLFKEISRSFEQVKSLIEG